VRRVGASLWFALHSAGQNFRRNLGVSLAGVFTMGLILFLVGGALLFTHSVNDVLQRQQANASHLRIYLSDSASLASIADFQSRLQHDPRVLSVSFENKDQAAREASQNPDIQSALTALSATGGGNPLPASLNLDVKRLTDLAALDDMAKATPIADKTTATDYNKDVIGKLNTVIAVIQWVGGVIAAILLVISLVIIMNTIRTAVYARRTEIEIMKLVGATDWFVRWPFILEGMIGGLLAAVFSGGVVYAGYRLFVHSAQHSLFSIPFDATFTIVLLVMLVVGGIAVGALGSFIGVRRFLTA
jgi:cell division transport system permease protein